MKDDSGASAAVAYSVFVCAVFGVVCLILTLARALSMRPDSEQASSFHKRTTWLFLTGIAVAFVGVFLDMASHFLSE